MCIKTIGKLSSEVAHVCFTCDTFLIFWGYVICIALQLLKFRYCEEATKILKYLLYVVLTLLSNVKFCDLLITSELYFWFCIT